MTISTTMLPKGQIPTIQRQADWTHNIPAGIPRATFASDLLDPFPGD
jgi:hypothetical protein